MEPGLGSIQGNTATATVISVCPYPSRSFKPVMSRNREYTSGFSGSPATVQYFSAEKSYLLQVLLDEEAVHGGRARRTW